MSKINHWGVGVTKLCDDIAGSVCDSHKVPFSKMAAINTITHNKVMQNVKSMAYSTSKSTFSGSRNAMVTSDMPMVNELQHSHWQKAESSSFKPGKPALLWMPLSTLDNFYTLNHEYTFPRNTVGDNATCSIWAPFRPWKTLYYVYHKVFEHLEKEFVYECYSVFWPFVLGRTVNTDFLRPIQWHIVL